MKKIEVLNDAALYIAELSERPKWDIIDLKSCYLQAKSEVKLLTKKRVNQKLFKQATDILDRHHGVVS